ncbi:MAG: hypothetical protein AB1393_04210 [Candidatus Edwardsbacteria bacterium]
MEKKEKHRKKSSGNSSVGEILIGCLTKEQIAQLLDVIFAKTDVAESIDELKKVDPDVAETLDKIVSLGSTKTREGPVNRLFSNKKILELWDSLWDKWHSIVAEVGDEEGKYAVQDADWEPPYFDGYALAEDLDEIAKDTVPLIDDVYDIVKNPNIFYDTIEEINSNISSYPEWMGEGEGCPLGKNVTRCVLKWFWLGSQKETQPGIVFLARANNLEEEFDNVYLNDDECLSFFVKLPDTICRQIYEQFNDNKYKQKVDETHSKWHKINHIYEERFDSTKYLETCNKHLAKNWQYGKPLIDDAIAQGNYQKADLLLQKTFLVYLHSDEKNVWYPETSLLLAEQKYYYEDDEKEIADLLNLWAEVSEKIGNAERTGASKLQSVMYPTPEDWIKVIYEYKKLRLDEARDVIDTLFLEWQKEMAERSIRTGLDKNISSDTWIHWLIESQLDVPGKKEWFLKKLNEWLDCLKNDGKAFKQQWILLARLTKDLPDSDNLKKQYPTFFKVVLPMDPVLSKLDKIRCEKLKEMDTGIYVSIVIDIWKEHLHCILPDPTKSHKSRYYEHAKWMRALYELNPDGYKKVLSHWQKTHKQRRNLWHYIKEEQLPV